MTVNLSKVVVRKAKKEDLDEIRELVRVGLCEATQIPFAKHVLKQIHLQVTGEFFQ